jgi:hypothetical protein
MKTVYLVGLIIVLFYIIGIFTGFKGFSDIVHIFLAMGIVGLLIRLIGDN